MQRSKVYFLTDAHMGSWAMKNPKDSELRLVKFLNAVQDDARAIYFLGDIFDFWYEYKYVIPKGYTRFLGKIAELSDAGIEIHFFTGNHDLWCNDYLEKECGVHVHTSNCTTTLLGKTFYLGHGDGLDPTDKSYLFLRKVFHSKICQRLFSSLHPRWAIYFGQEWARRSRLKHENIEGYFLGEEKDGAYLNSCRTLLEYPNIDYFIYGHLHVEIDLPISTSRFIILGDWLTKSAYAVFDGTTFEVKHFG